MNLFARSFVLMAAVLAAPVMAKNLIASRLYYVDQSKYAALQIELSDAVAPPETCDGMEGLHIAQTAVTNRSIFPRVIPHGRGCYFVSAGKVHVKVKTFDTGEVLRLEYNEDDFTKTEKFRSWPNVVKRKNDKSGRGISEAYVPPLENAIGYLYGGDNKNKNPITISLTSAPPEAWCTWGFSAVLEGRRPSFRLKRCWALDINGDIYVSGEDQKGENTFPVAALHKRKGFDKFVSENFREE